VSVAATRPRILIAPHTRELDTVLGRLRASIVYDHYLEKIVAAGGQPLMAWPGSPDVDDLAVLADGVVLMGGGDVAPERFGLAEEGDAVDRVRDEFETRLVVAARARETPVLGACRGAQVLNVALGGTLRRVEGHRQEADLTQPSHSVQLIEGTRLAATIGVRELDVNSFHNWAPDALGRGLRVAGTSAGVIEALESDGAWWALGIQWHLELLDAPASQRVFDALVAAAARAP
jgi:gamma-glutamyl-gamma-aminobutyrate hydrolase PuuD